MTRPTTNSWGKRHGVWVKDVPSLSFLRACLSTAMLGLALSAGNVACGDDDAGGNTDAATQHIDAATQNSDAGIQDSDVAADAGLLDETITVDATFTHGSITTGYRATVAVYRHEDYSDYSVRPTAMPMAALLGEEAQDHIQGTIMNLAQSEAEVFDPGTYSVVVGVSNATGMPSHLAGTPWIAKSVTITQAGQFLVIGPDDPDWKSE
ncbi:MAG: hypothetical protein J7M25_00970 [Deltaproteobacteria bacterium]|nr:hypothetical protein [Deltaproteobacteria bacterium]